jgi:hypothetical protein
LQRRLGILFVPLTTVAFEQRTDGPVSLTLSRNVGSSVGISVVSELMTRNNQVNHAFDNSAVLRMEPVDCGRQRGARSGHTNTGVDHQLYRRFQIDDDPLACRHSSRPSVAARPMPTGNDHAMMME